MLQILRMRHAHPTTRTGKRPIVDEMIEPTDESEELPHGLRGGRAIRAVLNAAGGAIPFAGGFLSAAASAWSEAEQEKINAFFDHWLKMLKDEMAEKAQTILEIMARLDMNDEKIAERVASPEYQALLRKAFRDWAGAESETKRTYVRSFCSGIGRIINGNWSLFWWRLFRCGGQSFWT